jgi:hypothetical protein
MSTKTIFIGKKEHLVLSRDLLHVAKFALSTTKRFVKFTFPEGSRRAVSHVALRKLQNTHKHAAMLKRRFIFLLSAENDQLVYFEEGSYQ